MNPYEILLLLDADLSEDGQNEIVVRVRELVERGGGTWLSHEPWGRRRLAYEIDKKTEGIYHFVTFDAAPETLDEIGRVLKIADEVVRFLAVRRVATRAAEADADRQPEYVGANARSSEEGE